MFPTVNMRAFSGMLPFNWKKRETKNKLKMTRVTVD